MESESGSRYRRIAAGSDRADVRQRLIDAVEDFDLYLSGFAGGGRLVLSQTDSRLDQANDRQADRRRRFTAARLQSRS